MYRRAMQWEGKGAREVKGKGWREMEEEYREVGKKIFTSASRCQKGSRR